MKSTKPDFNWSARLGTRYLLPGEKEAILAQWEEVGGADAGVAELLSRLNAVDGVCSVQSCIGHVVQRESYDYVQSGCIEMRLSEQRTRQFCSAMPLVGVKSWCEDICLHWRNPYQCAQVIFRVGQMNRAADALLKMFPEESTE